MAGTTNEQGDSSRSLLMGYLKDFERQRHYMPSIAQMSEATGLARNAVVWHLHKLREQKRVEFEDGNLARSLRLQ